METEEKVEERVARLFEAVQRERAKAQENERNYRFLAESIPQIVWEPVMHPEDLPKCLERWTHSLETGTPYEIEYRFKRADGVYRWHLGRALPVRDGDGKIIKWFGSCTDIDDQKRSEEALRQSQKLESVGLLAMNLVINGAEAIGENAGTVLVTTGVQDIDEQYIRTTFTPGALQPGKYVSLEVHDTGCGMYEDTRAKIFDPFFTTKFTGRGLGLAAALGIVRGHKGAIKVYSTPGKGSTFKVLFPAVEEDAAKAALQRYGYNVIVAENGQEAVDIFRGMGDRIFLILLDMTMPVMGGEETLRQLKAIRPDVRVILSSGFNEVEAIRRFTGTGLAGFVQKPYSAVQLAQAIKTASEKPF